MWGCGGGVTCSAEQHRGVGDTQQGVVKEALQHGCVHMEACGQVLGGDGRPTDEHSQTLTHSQRLGQPAEGERAARHILYLYLFHCRPLEQILRM